MIKVHIIDPVSEVVVLGHDYLTNYCSHHFVLERIVALLMVFESSMNVPHL